MIAAGVESCEGCENHPWVSVGVRQSVGSDCLACIRRRLQCLRIRCCGCSVDHRFVASGRFLSCNAGVERRVNVEERVRSGWIGTDYDSFVKRLGRFLVGLVS